VSYSPRSPQVVRGGFALLDLASRQVVRAVRFQYNPETLRRRLTGAAGGDGSAEVVELELVLDATDWLSAEDPQEEHGVAPQIAALESVAFPTRALSRAPLTVFLWGPGRRWPVRVLELVVTEEAFDQELHPIRARVAVTLELVRFVDHESGRSVVHEAHEERSRLAEHGAGPIGDLGVDEAELF